MIYFEVVMYDENLGWSGQIVQETVKHLRSLGHKVDLRYSQLFRERPIGNSVIFHDLTTHGFRAIDFQDFVSHGRSAARFYVGDPDCELILKSQYRQGMYIREWAKVKPYFYQARHPDVVRAVAPVLRQREIKHKIPTLYFRGLTDRGSPPRADVLHSLGDITNHQRKPDLKQEDFLDELSRYKIALSLSGNGNTCHREFEAMGVGTPCIMPELTNSFHAPLVSDIHYIPVPPLKNAAELAAAIKEKYLSVIEDDRYLEFVRQNAMRWYDKYIAYEVLGRVTCECLGYC